MGWRRNPRADLVALVARIDVPHPFRLDRFCTSIAEQRGRPLHLVPLTDAAGQDLPCGLWIGLPDADLVFYESGAAPILKAQIVLHEVSHMLLDHGTGTATVPAQRSARPARPRDPRLDAVARSAAEAATARLADRELGLDTDRVLALLARNGYTDRQEADAESLATLLLERATRAASGSGHAARVLARLDDAFGHPTRLG
ncbi:hypothetical protein ACFYNO_38025 [Kitasatospora sp. NPDC006697]|uniref:hypothetical protein n=1 Tax=Kitasatospora sp. NPDC006697 TaxID=3364020 RepID=UPI00368FC675